LITHAGRFGKLVAASLLFAPVALANEAVTPALASSAPVAGTPLVLGAPPAWGLMVLGAAVVGLTVLRRLRKTVPQRVPRR
jgi:hypothetical protein